MSQGISACLPRSISYFSVALRKHHNQDNLEKSLFGLRSPKDPESIIVRRHGGGSRKLRAHVLYHKHEAKSQLKEESLDTQNPPLITYVPNKATPPKLPPVASPLEMEGSQSHGGHSHSNQLTTSQSITRDWRNDSMVN